MTTTLTDNAFHTVTGQGGFAPKGGQYVEHKNGGEKFYKGGQFLPQDKSGWTKKEIKAAETFKKDLKRANSKAFDAIETLGCTGWTYEIKDDFNFYYVFSHNGTPQFSSYGMRKEQAEYCAQEFFINKVLFA